MHEDSKTKLASVIDEMENFNFALATLGQFPDKFHLTAVRNKLPDWLETLKGVHLLEHGENKWSR